ncbi:MAG: murein biosynthesis integral membrane protein MurJ [Patescibacteria group bacterium]
MIKNIWLKLNNTVAGGAIIISVAMVISKLLGLIRDRLLFSTFGAGNETDIYFAAFKLPDLIFNILVLGALSAAFIPIFIQYRDKENGSGEHWQIAVTVMNLVVGAMIILGVLAFIAAPWLVDWIAPGFDGAKQAETIVLTRIMLIAIIFFGISNVFSGILNAYRRFVAYSIAPILYNVGIIIGITVMYHWLGLAGLAWGVVLGAFLHMLIQLPGTLKAGYRHRWLVNWRLSGVKRIGKLFIPRMMGLAVNQVNFLVITIIATTLVAGSLSIFNAANNLQSFPISVFGVSLAIAAFPLMSQAFADRDNEKFVIQFSVAFRRVLFLIIPTSVFILLLRAQIVRVVLGAGAFDWEDTYLTAQALGYFSLSLFAQSLIPTLSRSFYALQNTLTPVKVSALSVGLNVVLSLVLVKYYGVIGLALAFSVASIVNMLLLLVLLRRRFGDLDDRKIIQSVGRIMLASLIAGIVTWISLRVIALGVDMRTFVGITIQGSLAGLAGLVSYIIIALVFRFDEVTILRQWVMKVIAPLKNHKSE